MTITVKLSIPAGKRAKVSHSGGEAFYEASEGDVYVGAVHADCELTIAEVDALPAEDDDGGVATTQGGGNGNGPPTPGGS